MNRPIEARPQRRDLRAARGGRAGRVRVASRWRCHAHEGPSRTPPAAMTKSVSEKPNGSTGESFGWTSPRCSTAARRGRSRRARGRQHGADDVEPGLGPGPERRRPRRGHRQDHEHEHDLADEDDPPGQLGGGPAAEDRPDGDAGAGDAADARRTRPCGRCPRSCPRSAPPSRAAPARRRCPRGPTSPGPGSPTVGATAVRAEPQA